MIHDSEQKEIQQEMRREYISRINRVIDYVESHIDEELSLEKLAKVANFSRFHFHRIFRAITGETLNQFIQRVRLEKAAVLLITNESTSITGIAFDCGFSGSSPFSRAFRNHFNMSASQYRLEKRHNGSNNCSTDSKNSQMIRKIRKDYDTSSRYIDELNHNPKWRIEMQDLQETTIEVKNMPEFHVVYARHTGPYKGDSKLFEDLFTKLFTWAGSRDLIRFPETKVLAVYHDSPEITDEDKLRTSACITVPEDTLVDGDIGKMTIAGGKYAVAHFELAKSDEYEKAWNMVYGEWLPQSGYQPDNRLCYEMYLNDPKEDPEGKHIVEICIPVKPL